MKFNSIFHSTLKLLQSSVLLILPVGALTTESVAQEATDSNSVFYAATFSCDATPPVGSPLAYDPMTFVDYPLSCKGLVLWSEKEAQVVI